MSDLVPWMPSVDGAELALVLRAAQWSLDDVAHDLPAGRATPERLRDLATVLEQLAELLRTWSGLVPDGADEPRHNEPTA